MALSVEQVGIAGAGTMGRGIAQVMLQAGISVVLIDNQPDILERARRIIIEQIQKGVEKKRLAPATVELAKQKLQLHIDLRGLAGCDVFIEAVPENLALKQELFAKAEHFLSPSSVMATNTSSLRIHEIAHAIEHKERLVGMHFFNPVHIMKLVEIIPMQGTDPTVVKRLLRLAEAIGKQPIVVNDSPGFASSRLGLILGLEAIRMLEQEVASIKDIDTAMCLGYGHPMGPLMLTDVVGLDVRLAIAEYLHKELGSEAFAPPQLLRDMVSRGYLGRKTQKGFYCWKEGEVGSPNNALLAS